MFITIYDNKGEILKIISGEFSTIIHQVGYDNYIEGFFDPNKYFIENSSAVLFPTRPSEYHIWNWETKTYNIPIEQLNNAKEDKLQEINVIRSNFTIQPIYYDNKALDADTQAQANINGKLQEIFAREAANTPLTSGEMFWKDADNVIHSWTNQNEYKIWLQGLVIAISSRNTSLYATAWTKKAEVEALTDINDIINYDINTGW